MAIAQLKRAMTKCANLGIGVFGMGYDLNAVTRKGVHLYRQSGEENMYGDSDAGAYHWAAHSGHEDETATVCRFGGSGGW